MAPEHTDAGRFLNHGGPSRNRCISGTFSPQWDRPPGDEAMSDEPTRDREHGVLTESDKQLKVPAMFKVLLHNDDYTTMEFVVEVLQGVFHRTHAEATQIMLHIHRTGIGVAGVYTHEVAETKVAIVEAMARKHEYPLKCTMEEA
jgi:ATP-dependent Clp protease adaptor protein ClpS